MEIKGVTFINLNTLRLIGMQSINEGIIGLMDCPIVIFKAYIPPHAGTCRNTHQCDSSFRSADDLLIVAKKTVRILLFIQMT